MPTRYLSDAELARLAGYPETIADEDLVTFFRLEDEDLRWVRERRGGANRLGLALQLCTLPWLGFVPDDLSSPPAAAVQRLAAQLGVEPDALASYGGWEDRTRRDHLREVLGRLGWRTAGTGELKALDDFLLARALEHDRPTLLVQLACDHLRAERVVRPGVVALMRRVAAARERAWEEAYERLQPLLVGPARRAQLDRLLEPDPALGAVPLVWLRRGATAASAQAIKAELAKLDFVRSLGGDRLDLSAISVGRRRFLASLGRRSRTQALARAGAHRRYPVLLATLAETAVEVLDELVELFDQALAGADRRARAHLAERALERAQSVEDRLDLLDELTAVLTDAAISDEEVGGLLRQRVGMDRLRAARRPDAERRTRDGGHLELLEARYRHLREFTPGLLAALPLDGGPRAHSLLAGVEVLRDLNRSGRRHLPDDAPTEFVPARWRAYVEDTGTGAAVRRHYWELAVLYGLQAALRSGDVWVPGSRRWSDPAGSLLPAERWGALREDFRQLTGMPAEPEERLRQLEGELGAALEALEPALAAEAGPVRLDTDGRLVLSPLPAEQPPQGTEALHGAVAQRLPAVDLAALLIEVDAWTGFTDALTHAGRSGHRPPELRRNLYAALLAQATNLGVAGMADAAGMSEETLAWTTQWFGPGRGLEQKTGLRTDRPKGAEFPSGDGVGGGEVVATVEIDVAVA